MREPKPFNFNYQGPLDYTGPAIGEPVLNIGQGQEAPSKAPDYKAPIDTVGWQPPFDPSGLGGLGGVLETADYLTAAPIRTGTQRAIQEAKKEGSGPWDMFKGFAKGVVESFGKPMQAPTGKDIASELGLSTEGLKSAQRRTGKLENIALPDISPAGAVGLVAESALDLTNLAGAGVVGAGIKKIKSIDDFTNAQLNKISKYMRNAGYDIRGGSDAYELMMKRSPRGEVKLLPKTWTNAIENAVGGVKDKKPKIATKDLNFIKKEMGTTDSFEEAGYIAQDGSLLDFSGKRDGAMGGERVMDHREIRLPESWGLEDGYSEKMLKYMDMGGIRIDANSGLLNLNRKPTPKQRNIISRYIRTVNNDEIYLEIGDRALEQEYRAKTSPAKILKDIDEYFEGLE